MDGEGTSEPVQNDPDVQLAALVSSLIAKGERGKAMALLAAYGEEEKKPAPVLTLAPSKARK